MIYNLNLPQIPDDLAARLLAQAQAMFANKDFVADWAKRRPYPYSAEQLEQENLVVRVGGYIEEVEELRSLLTPMLPYSAELEFFIEQNSRPGRDAVSAPAKDFARNVAISYLLQAGGPDVKMDVFLNESTSNEKKIYSLDLPVTSTYPLIEHSWIAYDSTVVTRTAGIQDMFIIISVVLDDLSLSLDTMMAEHKELFGAKIEPSFKAE